MSQTEPRRRRSFPIWLTIFLALIGGVIVTRGCSGDPAIIQSNNEYNKVLKEVEVLTSSALEKSGLGEPLTPADMDALDQAVPLARGLCGYDVNRFTHWALYAEIEFAREEWQQALMACTRVFETAPREGNEQIVHLVARVRFIASRCHFNERFFLEAAAEAAEAIKRKPRAPDHYWAEAAARMELGQKKEAKLLLETALVLNPDHSRSKALLAFLEKK